MLAAMERFAPNGRVRKMVKETEQRWKNHFGEPPTLLKVVSKFVEIKATWGTLREIVDPMNRHIRIPPAKRYHYFGKDIKDDGSIPYRKEYLNEDPIYNRDMKFQAVEQSLLGVATEVAQMLETPDSKLHDVVGELRDDASSLLVSLAGQLRRPNLDVNDFVTELREGIIDLISKAVEAGENKENGINLPIQNAKENLAALLEYYAKELQGGEGLKKLLTHPSLYGLAKTTLEAVSAIS
jgi:septum formation topological specificity factor MinE